MSECLDVAASFSATKGFFGKQKVNKLWGVEKLSWCLGFDFIFNSALKSQSGGIITVPKGAPREVERVFGQGHGTTGHGGVASRGRS